MNKDDLVYVSLLFISISFGHFYRKIKDVHLKKLVGAGLGFAIIFVVSGLHVVHILITVAVNSILIIYGDKRTCHLTTFAFSFLYLFFFRTTEYFGIPYPPGHTNLVQMILTLKLVGLAFEINSSYTAKQNKENINDDEQKLEAESNLVTLTIPDIFFYSFHYCGVLTGPYYRYRTFLDHLNKPYSQYDDYISFTLDKLKYVPLFGILYLWSSTTWPLSYTMTPEFQERSFLYRYWYIWPTFFAFRMRIYSGLVLSECVCTMAGLGLYPSFTKPKAGHGPTENFSKMKELTDSESLKKTSYDYETIHNINPYGADFCPTIREGMKNWNMCVQYWLAYYIYKRLPYKKFRTLVTMLVSAVWHGVYTGYYICIVSVPFGLMVEDVWVKILLKGSSGVALQISEYVMLFFKMQLFSYQAIAFGLLEVGKVLKYYNSVYHCMFFLYFVLYFLGKWLLKNMYPKESLKKSN